MKVCPACSREFPAERTHCDGDGVTLVAVAAGEGARAESLVGQVIDGRYRVEGVLGRGGMGTVYACKHVVVGQTLAIKVLHAGASKTDGTLQRFIREAQAANLVKSRHIVAASDFGQLPQGSVYVVMELLEGEDLTHALRAGRLSHADLTHVFAQVADTLQLAHLSGIIHRDLKPDNVFLVQEANDPLFVKLLDFGIAKFVYEKASHQTETGVILGTPYYMAPEQARGEGVDHRTDIYSLGVMMYRAYTGRLPFTADSTIGVLTRHLTDLPEPPSHIANVEPHIERVILRCMEKGREARFQSMDAVASALRTGVIDGVAQPIRHDPVLRDPVATREKAWPAAASGPYAAAQGSGPYAAAQGSGPYPAHPMALPVHEPSVRTAPGAVGFAHAMTPAGGMPQATTGAHTAPLVETGTSRAVITSSTGQFQLHAPAPRKSFVGLLALGGFVMAAAGAAAAFALVGLRDPAPAPAAAPIVVIAAPVAATAAPAGSAAPAETAAPVASASPAASADAGAPSAAVTADLPRPASLPAKTANAAPKPAPPPPPPTATAAAKRPTEIRSPFD